MILILRLIPGQHCGGCGAENCYVDEKCLLCLSCMDFKIRTEQRRAKLASTMAGRFADLKTKIQSQLREFGT